MSLISVLNTTEGIDMLEEIKNLFFESYGVRPKALLIAGGGGSRKYYRLSAGDISVIGVVGDDIKENEDFFNFDIFLEKHGVNVPHIIKIAENRLCYLLQDLGDSPLMKLLDSPRKMDLAYEALDKLIEFQLIPKNQWENIVGYPPFSDRLVKWDLNYFKYDFLKPFGISFDEDLLENDFDLLGKKLTSDNIINGLMYRDFQSRNIMVSDGQLWFIDFQAARSGPLAYDAVSFIWQAKAPFTLEEKKLLMNHYTHRLEAKGYDPQEIKRQLLLMQIFRSLQVLGAYGFRGLIEKKAYFLESLPLGVKNLAYLKDTGCLAEYPELERIAMRLIEKCSRLKKHEDGKLSVSVFSFSYKKGYPEDFSGNGGGFMFDCRAIHNPGRYEEYKNLTGKDSQVIEFLEKTDEATDFVRNCVSLVSPSIERYLKRGFTSLQVGFGCTGGQHRSVYCAQRFAHEIKRKFSEIKVVLIHREQGLQEIL